MARTAAVGEAGKRARGGEAKGKLRSMRKRMRRGNGASRSNCSSTLATSTVYSSNNSATMDTSIIFRSSSSSSSLEVVCVIYGEVCEGGMCRRMEMKVIGNQVKMVKEKVDFGGSLD